MHILRNELFRIDENKSNACRLRILNYMLIEFMAQICRGILDARSEIGKNIACNYAVLCAVDTSYSKDILCCCPHCLVIYFPLSHATISSKQNIWYHKWELVAKRIMKSFNKRNCIHKHITKDSFLLKRCFFNFMHLNLIIQ